IAVVRGQDDRPALRRQHQSLIEILDSIVGDAVLDVAPIELAGMGPFRDYATPVPIHRSEDLDASRAIEFRKSNFEVLDRDRTVAEIEAHDNRAERSPNFDRAL